MDAELKSQRDESYKYLCRTELAARIAEILAEKGFDVKPWQDRIYFNGLGRDIKAFLQIDSDISQQDIADVELSISTISRAAGLSLKVFSDCQQQSRKWRINRCKEIKHALLLGLQKAGYCTDVPADWRDVIL